MSDRPTVLQLLEAISGLKERVQRSEDECQNLWEKLGQLQQELHDIKVTNAEQGPARRQMIVLKRRLDGIKKEVDSLNLTRASTRWPMNLWEKALLMLFGAAVMAAIAAIAAVLRNSGFGIGG